MPKRKRTTTKLRRTSMRLDRELKKRLTARAKQEGRPFMRLLSNILRDGLADRTKLAFDATGYEPTREITTIRLHSDLLKRLETRAKTEERSCANITEIMLHAALIQRKAADSGTVFG